MLSDNLPSFEGSAGEICSLGVVSDVMAAIGLFCGIVRIFLLFILFRLVVSSAKISRYSFGFVVDVVA